MLVTPKVSSRTLGSEASCCEVVGMRRRIVRGSTHTFQIVSKDRFGERTAGAGDTFFVAVRGVSRIRARITDNSDGTYIVRWRPTVSGQYHVAVSLFGVHVGGSPFAVEVLGSTAYAPRCEARGHALERVVARTPANFEVVFRDRSGAPCKATELDGNPRPPAASWAGCSPAHARNTRGIPALQRLSPAPA